MSEDQNQATPTTESSPLADFFEKFAKFQAEQEEIWDYEPTYPIQVKGVEVGNPSGTNPTYRKESGALVKIRPVGEEYGGKTYLGIYLGDLTIESVAAFNKKEETLHIKYIRNPAIYVLSLKIVIYGRESWWATIDPSALDNVETITDDDLKDNAKIFLSLMKAAEQLDAKQQQTPSEVTSDAVSSTHSSQANDE